MKNAAQNIRIQKWVAWLSVTLLLIKLVAYYLTNSVAILTDALEGIVNVVAGFFGLYSLHLSSKPRDMDHPYGHGKVEFLSAAMEGGMILLAGALILYESVENLFLPSEIRALDTGILLITVTAVVNFLVGTLCIRTGIKNNTLPLVASGKHLQTDSLTTVGILVGLVLIYVTNILWIDSVVAILFGGWILFTGYKIVRKSIAGIMDESDMKLIRRMVRLLNDNRRKNWIDIHNLRIIKYGSVLHLDCHLTLPWHLNVQQANEESEALAGLVRKEFGDSIEMFVHIDASSQTPEEKASSGKKQHRKEWTLENIISDRDHSNDSTDNVTH